VEADTKNPKDIVLIGHHDPRGGHNGKDYPYAFPQVDYRGMAQSTKNFVNGEVINKKLCDNVPSFALSDARQLSCLHDGLQEWMLADEEFDCEDVDRVADGRCNVDAIKADPRKSLFFSQFDLMQRLATHPTIRTLLLGHTHYNSLEILQSGDEIAPGTVS